MVLLAMEKLLEILRIALPNEERWRLEEALDEYIDARIERRLDMEFNRGDWSHD
jgi:hypothetical protein